MSTTYHSFPEYEMPSYPVISETMVGKYKYTVIRKGAAYYVLAADSDRAQHHLDHGPFPLEQAEAMVTSRVRREEELKR